MKKILPPPLATVKSYQKADKVPEGWFTRRELEKSWRLHQSQAGRLIQEAIAAGKAQVRGYKIHYADRGVRITPHYRFK